MSVGRDRRERNDVFFTPIVQHSIYLEPYDEAVAYLDLIETDGDIKINIHS